MIKFFPLCLLTILLFLSCDKAEKNSYDLVISNVNIVDIRAGDILPNRVVAIQGDSIVRIMKTGEENDFVGRENLDAGNAYLMPGLWDMHVHFRGGDTLIEENKDMLPLFLAYGITTVRDAGGDITPAVLEWREKIKNGELVGPRIFTPGPKLDGTNPAWPGSIRVDNEAEIEAALDSLQAMGADYVKMYDGNLSREAFYQIIAAAERRGLKTTGHMPLSANFMEAIDHGLDGSEHMYYPLKAASPKADSLTQLNLGYAMIEEIIDTYDPALANKVFEKMSKNEVYVTPTLYIGKTLADILDVDHTKDTLLPYMGKGIQETYRGRVEGAKRARNSGSQMRQKMEEISEEMIVPMYKNGVRILAGSDCGPFNSYVYPGESLHGELRALSRAGLTTLQSLQTSVINGPEFFGLGEKYGSVEEGKVADLLLLEKNPLENLQNLQTIRAVVKAGRVHSREDLQEMLEDVKGKNQEIRDKKKSESRD
ncbi:amidohydrolase family protein [Antarcticibacterium flavum]|uniref:Amidohydrolase family protein n=1 Tax=Antarcticibacterium flavum TaxID=2058175 RepID=A0A5B7X4W1_9FLAO|nr:MULTISPECIES: amidohydrolase family protein [Antarcticibacterium]MCM4158544.1 amidohydrolase [Antarcticibacterium sp. W02-3]QCY70290.1 amidohydrolase family protein [Antarcticibacterium flavum]